MVRMQMIMPSMSSMEGMKGMGAAETTHYGNNVRCHRVIIVLRLLLMATAQILRSQLSDCGRLCIRQEIIYAMD